MATGEVHVSVVDVGQGQCTFVEIYNTAGKLAQTLLFDCGSDKLSDETQTNLQYIVDKVSSMDTPTFDCMFFSHSDKDHIWLTYDLLDKFSDSKKPKVKEVWYGGYRDQYTKYGYNILDYLEAHYCDSSTDIKKTNADYTSYNKTSKNYTEYLWKSPDKSVAVYAIVSNVISDDPDWEDDEEISAMSTAEAKNRVSMVCGLYYAGASYVICGDATNTTMAAINGLFSDGTTVFNKNNMTTLPHHGSRATGFAVKSSQDASFASLLVVSTFAYLLKSKSITISAYEKHRHPSLQLMTYFVPTQTTPILRDPRLKEKNTHMVTAYVDIDIGTVTGMIIFKNVVYSFETTINTFSTRYYDGATTFSYEIGPFTKASKSQGTNGSAINGFANWKYETQTNGNFLLGGYPNLNSALFTEATIALTAVTEIEPIIGRPKERELEKKEKPRSVNIKTVQTRRTSKKTYHPITNKNRFGNKIKHYH